jgi:hypothetical protein
LSQIRPSNRELPDLRSPDLSSRNTYLFELGTHGKVAGSTVAYFGHPA